MTAAAPEAAEKPKRNGGSYGAVEAILREHTGDIASLKSTVTQLGKDVHEIRETNTAIFGKLDTLARDLAKAPHVPSFREMAQNVGALTLPLVAVVGLLMWWNGVMFRQYAEPIKSAQELAQQAQRFEMDALRTRVNFLESALQFKPALREWNGH